MRLQPLVTKRVTILPGQIAERRLELADSPATI
jgi:hypothetical protein